MVAYIVRRLLSMIPTFLLAATLVFLFMHLIPGDPAAVMLGDMATVDQVEKLREEMGLNKPIYIQFGIWFVGVLKGDLGRSIFFEKPVLQIIGDRAETSIFIAAISMAIIILVGISTGIISAGAPKGLSSLANSFASFPFTTTRFIFPSAATRPCTVAPRRFCAAT